MTETNEMVKNLIQALRSANTEERISTYRKVGMVRSPHVFLSVLPTLVQIVVRISTEEKYFVRHAETPGCPECGREWVSYEKEELLSALASSPFSSLAVPELLKIIESPNVPDEEKVGIVFALGRIVKPEELSTIVKTLEKVATETTNTLLGVAVVDTLRALWHASGGY